MDCIDVYSFFHARLVYKSWIPCRLISIAHATTRCLDTQNVTTEDKELIDCKPRMDRIYFVPVIKDSSHRDGAIYKNKFIREDFWEGDIADRNESKWSKMTKSLSSNLYAYCRMSFFCKYIFMCTDLFLAPWRWEILMITLILLIRLDLEWDQVGLDLVVWNKWQDFV